jgi:NAD(P)-dependent dehydrogenase (short-subunit alcohol dehydrogenase family)
LLLQGEAEKVHNVAALDTRGRIFLTKSVALHCARNGWDIRCNSVHPTFVRTPILDSLVGDRDEATVLGKLARQVPLGRLSEADDVANAIVYLASDESRFMTGAEIKLDGGISAMWGAARLRNPDRPADALATIARRKSDDRRRHLKGLR